MIHILDVAKLTDYKWMNLFDVRYANEAGKEGHWTFASRKAHPTPGNAPLVADAVVVIPLLKDGYKRKLVVTKEFRIPMGDYEYGLPAGLYDHNESAEAVAKRELKEETGLKLTKVLYVSPPSVSSAGLSDESVVYVVCECIGKVSKDGLQDAEDITVELLDLDGLKSLRESGAKISAKALPYYLMFEGMKKIAWPKHLRQEHPQKGFTELATKTSDQWNEIGYGPNEEEHPVPTDERLVTPELHQRIVGDYTGAYALYATSNPTTFVLKVESDAEKFPTEIDLHGVKVPVVVHGNYLPPVML